MSENNNGANPNRYTKDDPENPPVEFLTDLEAIAKATATSGQFLRVKTEPVEVELRHAQVLKTRNKFGRDEYRMTVKRDGKEYLLAMSKLGMSSIAKALIASKTPLASGVRLSLARIGSGFDTAFKVTVLGGPPAAVPPPAA